MVSRVYTVEMWSSESGTHLECFKGFDRKFQNAEYIAVVLVYGEIETWALDDDIESPKELRRYYVVTDKHEEVIIQVYKSLEVKHEF